MGYTKSYPTPVNRDLLFEEFVAADIQANFAVDYIEVTDATPEATTDGIIAAHDGTQQTTEQQQQADKQLTQNQIKDYLRTQLINPAPDLATIKNTIESAVGGNSNVQQAITNIASLYGYDTATNAGYVRSALLVISILT